MEVLVLVLVQEQERDREVEMVQEVALELVQQKQNHILVGIASLKQKIYLQLKELNFILVVIGLSQQIVMDLMLLLLTMEQNFL